MIGDKYFSRVSFLYQWQIFVSFSYIISGKY